MNFQHALLYALTLLLVTTQLTALARGCGGGGFRGGGGDFRGGDVRGGGFGGSGDRSDFGYRTDNDDHWGNADPWSGDNSYGRSPLDSRPGQDAPAENRAMSQDPAYANHSWNDSGTAQKALASDGFGNVMSSLPRGAMYGNHTMPVTDAALGSRGDLVRQGYHNWNAFDRGWWGNHPYGWYRPWFNGGWAWGYCGWPALAGFWGVAALDDPVDYDYGNNITYQNNNVYYGTQQTATAEQYYDQADQLAESAPPMPPPSDPSQQESNWKPLGVFSLVQSGQTDSTMLMQLAVDKSGTIRGNYYNTLTDAEKPISGAVDKKTMRAAWTVSGDKNVVYDTGVSNLLKPQSPILIHFDKNKTEQWTLVRLQKQQKTS